MIEGCFIFDCEDVYSSIDCKNCFSIAYCRSCVDCRDMYLSEDCVGSENCIGCSGLVHKQFQILNKPVTKEAYELVKNDPSKLQEIRIFFQKLSLEIPKKYIH